MIHRLYRFTHTHVRLLSYTISSLFIATWTVLKFLTDRTIFDLVGQQVLGHQLLHGGISGAGIGVTNYIPKLVLLYIPLDLIPGSPRLKLILLTVLVNVATLILIGLIAEQILRDYGVRYRTGLSIALIWLSVIAGSVFWVQFTNSRDLEVAGGLLLLYLGLRLMRQPGCWRFVGLVLFSTLLFFADTLQIYMTALPLVVYGLTVPAMQSRLRAVALLAGGLWVGIVGSKLLFVVAQHALSVHFLRPSSSIHLSVHFFILGIVGSAKAFLHLYAGGGSAGKIREVYNLAFFALLCGGVVYAVKRQLLPRRLLVLVGTILVINETIYVLSGQAQQGGTERYLIMTAPALVLLFGSLDHFYGRFRWLAAITVSGLIVVNAVSLGGAVGQATAHHFSQDAHLASVERYISRSGDRVTYASMDTALPINYLYHFREQLPLPVGCTGITLQKTTTFYSQTSYAHQETDHPGKAALILDGSAITNVPSVCRLDSILAQIGQPKRIDQTDDGSIVLLYDHSLATILHY